MAKKAQQLAQVIPLHPAAPQEHYAIHPVFEQAFITALTRSELVWRVLGDALDPKMLPTKPAQTLATTAVMIARETHKAPCNLTLIMQRMERLVDDGKLSCDERDQAIDYATELVSTEIPEPDAIIAQMVPVIKTVLMPKLAIASASAIPTREVGKVLTLAKRIEELGIVCKPSVANDWEDEETLAAIERYALAPRLTTGIRAIDEQCCGGIAQGLVFMLLAGTGIGKGIALVQQEAEALLQGRFVAHATLEDPEEMVRVRLIANLLGADLTWVEKNARHATRLMLDRFGGSLGRFKPKEFERGVTTNQDIENWIDAEEQVAGRAVDLVGVDYAGLQAPPRKAVDYEGKKHRGLEAIFARWAVYADNFDGRGHKAGPIWMTTPQQIQRSNKASTVVSVKSAKSRPVGTDDVADGIDQSRIAGFVMSLNPVRETEDDEPFVFPYVGKNRRGKAHFGCDPMPMALEQARLFVPSHRR